MWEQEREQLNDLERRICRCIDVTLDIKIPTYGILEKSPLVNKEFIYPQ